MTHQQGFVQWLRGILSHPLTRGHDLDDPTTTLIRREIVKRKPLLKQIYQEWYRQIVQDIPTGRGMTLEIGSGAGFLEQFLPGVITSEVFYLQGVKMVLDAHALPFADKTLKAVVMSDVMHHLKKPRLFLRSAARCVMPGGVVVMVEPWVSGWSRFVYKKFHHEPFNPEAAAWELDGEGPLTVANNALPWMIFERDRVQFTKEFPEWVLERIHLMMPFLYLLSGGVGMISLAPGWAYPIVSLVERLLTPWMKHLAMFALIVLRRQEDRG